jgi:hypothetical protein
LADLLATAPEPALRNGKEAVQLATLAVAQTSRQNPLFLSTLAEAYAEAGRLTEAVVIAREAAVLARAQGRFDLVQSITARLQCFESGLPAHQPSR